MTAYDVVIVGAGPYGLSVAAHLQALKGLQVQIFGEPMGFWERNMPRTMFLRSPWQGSHLSDPGSSLRFDSFIDRSKDSPVSPVPLSDFVAYGHWFKRKAVGEVDGRKVVSVERSAAGFRLLLNDGDSIQSRQVVISTGIASFTHRPEQFAEVSPDLASHSSDHRDFIRFSGRRVVVIGGGQSALEYAALLHESGSDVEVVARDQQLHWTWNRPWLHTFKPVSKLLFAPSDVGPAFLSHVIAAPALYRRLPRGVQDRWGLRATQPSVAHWLRPRVKDVRISLGRAVTAAETQGEQLKITLSDHTDRLIDHVVLATGYKINISRYSFLSPEILASIEQVRGCPKLNAGFESTVPGLFFLGAPAMWSFGPLLRFVAGAEFAAPRIAKWLATKINPSAYRDHDEKNEFARAGHC